MRAFAGTLGLTRLALRRDRFYVPVWLAGLTLMVTAFAAAAAGLFATQQELTAATSVMAANPVFRAFGLASGATIGAFALLRGFVFAAVFVALMSAMIVARHTRQNEETRRAEMIGAAATGRYASLTAALAMAVGVNAVLAILISLGLMANDLPAVGALAAGVAFGGVGVTFASVTAIMVQPSATSRGAIGLTASAIGLAFLLRALGDMLGTLTEDGLKVISAWPSWLSPLGWGQQVRAFDENNWWVLGLVAVFFLTCLGIAFALIARRDLGMGMLPEKRGPAFAPRTLLSPMGLAWRNSRNTVLGWAVGIATFGAVFGAVADQFESMVTSIEQGEALLARLGGTAQIQDAFFTAIISLLAAVVGVFLVPALLRIRADEVDGPLESVLARAVSRPAWLMSHAVVIVSAAIGLLLLAGVSTGIAAGLVLEDVPTHAVNLGIAASAQVPAALALAGFVVAVYGLLPKRAVLLSWLVLTASIVLGPVLGAIFDLPQALLNLSPYTHAPGLPADEGAMLPISLLLATAVGLWALGILSFSRRNLQLAG